MTNRERGVRALGLVASLAYGVLVTWVYAQQPQTVAQLTGGVAATVGAYEIDQASFDEGLRYFRADRFEEARSAFARADRAQRDPVTQYYVAYSLYRQGWGRVYNDDALFTQSLQTLDRAIAASKDGRVVVADPGLGLHTSDELKAELQRGLRRELSDLNPMRVFRKRL